MLREAECLAQADRATKWQNWDLNRGQCGSQGLTLLLCPTTEHSFSEHQTGVCIGIPRRAHDNTGDRAPVPKCVIQWFWGAPENLHCSYVPGEAAVHLASEQCRTGRTTDLNECIAAPKSEFCLQFQEVHGSPAASTCTLEGDEGPLRITLHRKGVNQTHDTPSLGILFSKFLLTEGHLSLTPYSLCTSDSFLIKLII